MTASVVVFGGVSITRASLDLPDSITFLLYIGYLVEPVQKLTHMTEQLQEGVTGFERFAEILDIKPEIADAPGALDVQRVRGDIEFRNVGFAYQSGHAHVLKNISLRVKAGDYVALVGSSGVGKTTLCSLIPRFYDVDEATNSLDNESEKVVQDSLEALAVDRTTFVIAHRLSTVRKAQQILVLTDHGIGEEGRHEELLALNGVYARLYHAQLENIAEPE